jgi:hypothetical protein
VQKHVLLASSTKQLVFLVPGFVFWEWGYLKRKGIVSVPTPSFWYAGEAVYFVLLLHSSCSPCFILDLGFRPAFPPQMLTQEAYIPQAL